MSGSKKKNKAVALKYNSDEDAAPIVIASGYGITADKIIDIAEQRGIPVFRDDSAASLMCMLDIGANIPPELYEVVAAIYVELLKTSAEIKGKTPQEEPEMPNQKIKDMLKESRERANRYRQSAEERKEN